MKAREYLELMSMTYFYQSSEPERDSIALITALWKECPEFEMGDFVWSEDKTYFGIVTNITLYTDEYPDSGDNRQFRWIVEWHKWQEDITPPFRSPEFASKPPTPAAREEVKRKFPTSLVWKESK